MSKSQMIFYGTAETVKSRGSSDRIEFEIEQVYKGDEDKEVVSLYASRFAHDCGVRFTEGQKYMVYAIDFYPRGVATTMCLGTYPSDEPPAEDAWKKVDVDIPDTTKVEKEMRQIAKKIAETCATRSRVRNAGFALILSPNGDPMKPEFDEKLSPRDAEFAQCMADEFISRSDLPDADEPILIKGWWQQQDRSYPILLDQRPCDDNCSDWGALVKTALLDVRLPDAAPPQDEASAKEYELEVKRQTCVKDGFDAIFTVPQEAGRAAVRKHNTMLVDCAVSRGEFAKAVEFAEQAEIAPAFLAAIEWANEKGEGGYPVSEEIDGFPNFYFDGKGKPGSGDFRVLRTAFLGSTGWASQPLFLEAFAQSIVADKSTSEGMRNLAALAYRKAARLAPDAEAPYRELARKASSSNAVDLLVAELDEAYSKAVAAREKAKAAQAVVPEENVTNAGPVEQAPVDEGAGQNDMVVLAGGLLLLVAIAGGLFLFARRKKV